MPKITLETGDITSYSGDAIICPSDVELTHKGEHRTIRRIFEKAGPDLLKELAVIGRCEVGNAVITKGYSLKVTHLIFMPFTDHTDEESMLDSIQLHQGLKSAFTLAGMYEAKRLAIPLLPVLTTRRSRLERLLDIIWRDKSVITPIGTEEMMDIVAAVAREYLSVLEEVTIYR